eukprot:10005933-Alexandrium_andersonii.AAC.1
MRPRCRRRALRILGRTQADRRAQLAEYEPWAGSSPRPLADRLLVRPPPETCEEGGWEGACAQACLCARVCMLCVRRARCLRARVCACCSCAVCVVSACASCVCVCCARACRACCVRVH